MANDLDEIMSLDPLELTLNDERLEAIIAYQRRHRANLEAGIKPKKEAGPKKELGSILDRLIPTKPKADFKRRI